MGATLTLPFFSAETGAAFDKLPDELLMRVVRTLLRDDPQALCRLMGASRALRRLVRGDSAEAAELRAARALLTQQRLFELRVAAGLESEGGVPALVRSISRQLSFVERPPPAPVTELDLRSSRWRVAGDEARGRAVARFVRVSGSMATLHLGGNSMGNVGANALAEAVRVSGSLVTLVLEHNQIGNEGAQALAEAVSVSGSLVYLNLNYNDNIGNAAKQSLRDAVQGRQGFELLV